MTATPDVDPDAPKPYEMLLAPVVVDTGLGPRARNLAIGVLVGSLVMSVFMGFAAAPYAYNGPQGAGVSLQFDSEDPHELRLAVIAGIHMLVGTVLGTWALIQGIVAVSTKRGAGAGVAAIVVAFIAPGLSLAVYMSIAIANAWG